MFLSDLLCAVVYDHLIVNDFAQTVVPNSNLRDVLHLNLGSTLERVSDVKYSMTHAISNYRLTGSNGLRKLAIGSLSSRWVEMPPLPDRCG